MLLDLHMHSTSSDGQYSPSELMDMSKKKMLSVVALTDHDTVLGVKEAKVRAKDIGLKVISGIEISTMEDEEIHILGLGIDENDAFLLEKTRQFVSDRDSRGMVICDYLKDKGIDIDYDEILKIAGSGSVGRPHFAQFLNEHGYVKTRKDAFTKYIDTPEFHEATDRKMPDAIESIEIIHRAGGLAVLAHPGLMKKDRVWHEKFIKELVEKGLDGIEAFYSKHDNEQVKHYVSIAEKYNLGVSCGSDFHGEAVKPAVALGMQCTYKGISEFLSRF